MAYVMLGRHERLEDIYIAGDFKIEKIRCSPSALRETQRLAQAYQETLSHRNELKDSFKVSFVNARSLGAHFEDITHNAELMSSTVIGLGETWLEPSHTIQLPSYYGTFVNMGRGKGLAAYSRIETESQQLSEDLISATFTKINDIVIIFMYLSQGMEWSKVQDTFNLWLQPNSPTIIMGDMNWHWSPQSKHPMKSYLQSKGFRQVVKTSTHDLGNCLDHIYISKEVELMNPTLETHANYFTDHDTVSLVFPAIKLSQS